MSWSTSASGPGDMLEQKISEIDCCVVPGTDGLPATPEVEEQIALAKKLAIQAVNSGAVGDTSCEFSISMSGHANPTHNPHVEGASSADCINISISQTSCPEPLVEDDEEAEQGS